MTLGFQARASQRVLSRMGQDALLRGAPAGKVHLARSVSLFPGIGDVADDNSMVRYDMAMIAVEFSPRAGDVLEFIDDAGAPVSGESYVLDRLVSDNGHNVRFIVSRMP